MNKKTCILMCGPPGSGKSSLSKEMYSNYVYVNQDSQGLKHFDVFDQAILAGQSIVVDRMNFTKLQRNRYLDIAKKAGYHTEIIVIYYSYETCYNRMLKRKNHETIKDEKSRRSALHTFFTKYEPVTDDEADFVARAWPLDVEQPAVIIDLDGTLCNVDHRLHFVRDTDKKDWKSFFEQLKNDTVNEWCKDIVEKFSLTHPIVYCSGRPDDYKNQTIEWLQKNDVYFSELYMRRRGDYRPDHVVKSIILDFEILTRYKPYFFVDDRKSVVDLYRNRGFTVLQCSEGAF